MKFGCFTFGGGWSIVAQMQKLYVEEKKLLTNEDLIDLTSVGRSLPGTMIGNIAMLYGHRMAGYPGGVACVIGMILPPMVILTIITYFYTIVQNNIWIIAAMTGIRTAVVPIIACAMINMVKGAYKFPPCYLVTVITAALYLFFGVSCIWLVVIGIVCGLLISDYYERKGGEKS
jgi:chromate transporter